METTTTHDLAQLALRAKSLAAELNGHQLICGHETTSAEILIVSQELTVLAAEVSSLEKAMCSNGELYTSAFHQDLSEIVSHLHGIFDDVSDCAKAMTKADGPSVNAVGWLHKKRYVHKLQKHLAANKTTLTVMRTVIRHGKNYGTHNSPGRLAESSPHTLTEDWSILEAVFASRSAITDLEEFANSYHQHGSSSSSGAGSDDPTFEPGAHGRNLSAATGVDVPAVGDVLPASNAQKRKKKEDGLARRFSKRGVRLAVHSSILDLNAHDVPTSLKQKWITQAQNGSLSIAQLSKISEVDSTLEALPRRATTEEQNSPAPELSKLKKRSLTLMATPFGKSLGRVIGRLSSTGLGDSGKEEDGALKSGWSYRLTKPFVKPELTTPDFEKDVESSALR